MEGRFEEARRRRELARATGRSRKTVRHYLREGKEASVRKPAPKRPEKLDRFKDYIIARTTAAAPIAATVLYRETAERGYDGGIRIVTHQVTTSGSDRAQLARVGKAAKTVHRSCGSSRVVATATRPTIAQSACI